MYKCRVEKGDIAARAYAPEHVAGDRSEFDPRQIQHWISCRIQAKSNTAQSNTIQHNPTLDQLQDPGQIQHCTIQHNPTQSNNGSAAGFRAQAKSNTTLHTITT